MPAILGLIRDLAAYERAADQVRTTAADLEDLLFGGNTPSGTPAAHCHVVDDPRGSGLAGIALWYLTTSTWTGRHGIHLEDLYVRPELRGRGYGVALMAELAHVCRVHGYARLEWAVLDWNRPAWDFYEALGSLAMAEWTTHRLAGDSLEALARRRVEGSA